MPPQRTLAARGSNGEVGWLPAHGTQSFHRPLSNPRADLRLRFHGSECDGRNAPEADMLRFIRQGSLRDTGDTEWLRRDIAMKPTPRTLIPLKTTECLMASPSPTSTAAIAPSSSWREI